MDSNLGADGVQGEISEIATILGSPDGTVSAIPPLSFDVGKITGYGSIFASGQLPNLVQISLVNDTTAPPNTSVYGADTTGNPGWYPLFDGFATTTLSLTQDATTGIVSFDLPVITPTAGGTLQKYGFDTYGRMDQESSATTDDLTEGTTNLYFTNKRAQDAVGNILANTPDIDLAYNPSTPSISATLVQITANALTALTYPNVVALDGAGNAYYPDLTNPADVSRIVGVTTNAAAMGAPVGIVTSKTFTESAWGWSPGRIYCAVTGGALTQTAPATGAVVEVARVITPTTIHDGVQPAILR